MNHLSIQNFKGYPLQEVRIDTLTNTEIVALTTGEKFAGRIVYNTTTNKYLFWNGTAWIEISDAVIRAITGTAPITASTVGTTTTIGIDAATTSLPGSMSAADKTKLDGISAKAKPVTSTVTPINANAAVPAIGSNENEAARADHKHSVDVAAPIDIGTANSAGTSDSLSRADHVHRLVFSIVNSVLATANAAIDINGQRITNAGSPVNGSDLVTKDYAEMLRKGSDMKDAVRCVATSNITLSGLQTIDTITVVAGDRVGVVGQTDKKQNGIYIAASGAWSRSDDANSSTNFTSGLSFTVTEGSSSWIGSTWICTTPDPITLGTSELNFVLGSGAMLFSVSNDSGATGTGEVYETRVGNDFQLRKLKAGGNYMTITNSGADLLIALVLANILLNDLGGTLGTTKGGTNLTSYTQGDIIYASAANVLNKLAKNSSATRYLSNQGTSNNPSWSQVNLANGVTGTLPVANGGTGGTTADEARANLGAVGKKAFTVGDGSATQFTLTHNLGSLDVAIQVYRNSSPYDTVGCDTERVDANNVIIKFGAAPTTNQFKVIVIG